MKRRFWVLLTAIVMVFTLAACGGKQSLEQLLSSSDWQDELKDVNKSVDGTGINITTEADGNVLVFTWHLPDDELYGSLDTATCEEMAKTFLKQLSGTDFLTMFKDGYGISLDNVRCRFEKHDGTEICSADMK